MRKVEKQSKAKRIYEALLKHNGMQVGGDYSNRIEIDVSVLLELFALEDRIQELEQEQLEDKIEEINVVYEYVPNKNGKWKIKKIKK